MRVSKERRKAALLRAKLAQWEYDLQRGKRVIRKPVTQKVVQDVVEKSMRPRKRPRAPAKKVDVPQTYVEAFTRVLQEHGKPMRLQAIYDAALAQGWVPELKWHYVRGVMRTMKSRGIACDEYTEAGPHRLMLVAWREEALAAFPD